MAHHDHKRGATSIVALALALALAAGCDGDSQSLAEQAAQSRPLGGTVDRGNPGDGDAVLDAASAALLAHRRGDHWNFTYELGTPQSSLFYMTYAWLGITGPIDAEVLVATLRAEQYPDGSWASFYDPNLTTGTLDTTVINYMGMKLAGVSATDPAMLRARDYVLDQGGAEEAIYPTVMLLALFDSYPWSELPGIPSFVTDPDGWVTLDDFAQWIAPNFRPVAYMRSVGLSRDLGTRGHFFELLAEPIEIDFANLEPGEYEASLIAQMLETQLPHGSWGGYLAATLLTVVCLDDFSSRRPAQADMIAPHVDNALAFVELVSDAVPGGNRFGVPSDGRYWDTALAIAALSAAGVPSAQLDSAARLLAGAQREDGAMSFGLDFETMPDLDDTAEAVLALHAVGGFDAEIERAVDWMLSMQNDDGGWGAFRARDNAVDGMLDWILSHALSLFAPAAFFYDRSAADVTGHVLEALGAVGYGRDHPAVAHAVEYLEDTQVRSWWRDQYMWEGTWGVNYLYGTAAAVVGLVAVGVSPRDDLVTDAIAWLEARQNPDGGFGETTDSYHDRDLAGVGISTASQTAWVLTALVAAERTHQVAARRAAGYLVDRYAADGQWHDPTITGTGHPGFLYMRYRAYPWVFPVMALSRYSGRADP